MGKTSFSWEVFPLVMLNRRLNVNVSKSWGRNSTLHQHTHGHGDAASASAYRVGEGLGQDGDDPHPVASCPLAATEGLPMPPHTPWHGEGPGCCCCHGVSGGCSHHGGGPWGTLCSHPHAGTLWGPPCVTGLYTSANKQLIALKELSLLALRLAVLQTLSLARGI